MNNKIYVSAEIDIEQQIEGVLDILPISSTDYNVIHTFLEEYLNQIEFAFNCKKDTDATSTYKEAIAFIKLCYRFLLITDANIVNQLHLLIHFIYTQAKEYYTERGDE